MTINKADWTVRVYDIVYIGTGVYNETVQAQATSRVTDGTQDQGYNEWVGYGVVDGVPVMAIYLIDSDDQTEDAGDYDWDAALEQGRIVYDADRADDETHEAMTAALRA